MSSSFYSSKNEKPIPSNSIVRDDEKISEIYGFLRKVWNVESLTPNPCALPISLERKHLDFIVKEAANYTVAEKSDGVRYFLVLGKYQNGDRYSVMLDRNLVPYEIALVARDEVFTGGTVMDGELIWEYYSSVHPPRQLYLIFDALCHCGIDYQTKNYIDRLNIINSIFYIPKNDLQFVPEKWLQQASEYAEEKKIVSLGNSHNLVFASKSCQSIANIDILVRNLNTFHHASDGLLFTPINERVRRGRHQTMFKWKKKHSIDIILTLMRETSSDHGWTMEISLLHEKNIVSYENLVKFEDENVKFHIIGDKFLRSMLAHLEKKRITYHEVLVEALVSLGNSSEEEMVWNLEPFALRRDKNVPNALHTIERTLVNVAEAITIEELVNVLLQTKDN